MANLSLGAKLHLVAQCLGLALQTLLPELGLNDHLLHQVVAVVAYLQGVLGLWAIFLNPHTDAKQ